MKMHVLPVVLVAAALAGSNAFASDLDQFFHACCDTFRTRNAWPEPYATCDRDTIYRPFAEQVCKGWELQNMIADHHFVNSNGQLTEAGRLKIQWILTDVAPQHRAIYVHKALRPDETAARMAAVRQAAALMTGPGEMVAVLLSSEPAANSPADRIDITNRKSLAVMPDPRLPNATGSGGGGGGGTGPSGGATSSGSGGSTGSSPST